jgi:hypothetical protein
VDAFKHGRAATSMQNAFLVGDHVYCIFADDSGTRNLK